MSNIAIFIYLVLLVTGNVIVFRIAYDKIEDLQSENEFLRNEIEFKHKVLEDHNDMLVKVIAARGAQLQEILIHLYGDVKSRSTEQIVHTIDEMKTALRAEAAKQVVVEGYYKRIKDESEALDKCLTAEQAQGKDKLILNFSSDGQETT